MSNSKKNKKGHIMNQFFSIIIDEIKPLNPQAIIIYGSYGRNEGAWILDKNNFLPYNDFDIVVVDDSTNNSNYNKKLNESLKKKLNVDWIDLQVLSRKKLKSLSKRTIFNYDLKYGSKVIYGDKGILGLIPLNLKSKINIKDLEVLFNTRLWTFYGSYVTLNSLDEKKSRFFKYQMSKAILASIESFLIRNNYYNCSYKLKVKKFIEISNENHELALWALEEKLNPSDEIIGLKDAKVILNNVRKMFFNEFFLSMSLIYNTQIKSPVDIVKARTFLRYKIKNFIKFFFMNEKNVFKKNNIKDLELMLAVSNDKKDLQSFEPFFSMKMQSLNLKNQSFKNLKEEISTLRFQL